MKTKSMQNNKRKKNTLTDLLREKPKRGRPRHSVSRQSVYVELTGSQKTKIKQLADKLPKSLNRADVSDLVVFILAIRFEALRRTVANRNREMPEGIMDIDSLYLLWDLTILPKNETGKWTSIRLSPQQLIQLGRVYGVLHALFGSNRSEVYNLGLALLDQEVSKNIENLASLLTVVEFKKFIETKYLENE